jgi:hypothetical protein
VTVNERDDRESIDDRQMESKGSNLRKGFLATMAV